MWLALSESLYPYRLFTFPWKALASIGLELTGTKKVTGFYWLQSVTGKRLYEAAHSVDEVKDIRDKALAMQAYARQAQDNELQIWAGEIKMRAERRAGQLLKDMDKSKGGGDTSTGTLLVPVQKQPTLSDIGVTKKQSSAWQKVANVSEDEFERHIAVDTAKGTRHTSDISRALVIPERR